MMGKANLTLSLEAPSVRLKEFKTKKVLPKVNEAAHEIYDLELILPNYKLT